MGVTNPPLILPFDGYAGMPAPSSPYAMSVGSAQAIAAQSFRAVRVCADRPFTVNALRFWVTTASSGDDPIEVGIYDALGNLVGKGVSTGVSNSTGLKIVPLNVLGCTLQFGQVYYAGLYANALTSGLSTLASFISSMSAGRWFGDLAPNMIQLNATGIVGTLPPTLALAALTTGNIPNFLLT